MAIKKKVVLVEQLDDMGFFCSIFRAGAWCISPKSIYLPGLTFFIHIFQSCRETTTA